MLPKLNVTPIAMNLDEIMDCIPHRYPMLMIDSVEDMYLNKSAIGIKTVNITEPFFEGHFPTKPIMPGVFIIEAMGQTAGVLVCKTLDTINSGKLVYFMSIEEAKFRKPVVPGDVLRLHVEKNKNRGNVWKFDGRAYVSNDLVAESTFTAMIIEK